MTAVMACAACSAGSVPGSADTRDVKQRTTCWGGTTLMPEPELVCRNVWMTGGLKTMARTMSLQTCPACRSPPCVRNISRGCAALPAAFALFQTPHRSWYVDSHPLPRTAAYGPDTYRLTRSAMLLFHWGSSSQPAHLGGGRPLLRLLHLRNDEGHGVQSTLLYERRHEGGRTVREAAVLRPPCSSDPGVQAAASLIFMPRRTGVVAASCVDMRQTRRTPNSVCTCVGMHGCQI